MENSIYEIVTFFEKQQHTQLQRQQFWQAQTKQLLKNFRVFREKSSDSVVIPPPMPILCLSLYRGQSRLDIPWILENPERCTSISRYIETMVNCYQNSLQVRGNDELIRWRILYGRYIQPLSLSRTFICEREHISKSTLYRYEAQAIGTMSVLLFGAVAVF